MFHSMPAAEIERFISGLLVFLISDVMTMVYLYAIIKKKNSDEILVKFDAIPNHQMTQTLNVTL